MSQVTIRGLVATTPRHLITAEGKPITSFRLAESRQVWSKEKFQFVDVDTNWFTVTSFDSLAINAKSSISKGDKVLVIGALRIRDWDNGERAGTSVEVEADSIGHDLSFGESSFTRTSWNGKDVMKEDQE